jgi:hypothetical protein
VAVVVFLTLEAKIQKGKPLPQGRRAGYDGVGSDLTVGPLLYTLLFPFTQNINVSRALISE